MAANPKIVYVGQNGATQVGEVQIDGTQPIMWATFLPDSISDAALSPDGKFVVVQADSSLYVATNGLPTSWQNQPLFSLDENVSPSDLLSVSWLPDSSGFVFVSLADGKPELHLAQLNMPAIDYLKSLSQTPVTPIPFDLTTPFPTPTPFQIALLDPSAINVSRVSFLPDQSVVFDRNVASDFGLEFQADSAIHTLIHIVAYGLRSGEPLSDCATRSIPVDRPFWTNQADYAAGAITFSQHFMFADEQVEADRLLVRLNVLDATANDRLLYCEQQVYAVSINVTPAPPTLGPTATSAPPTLAPTATPGPALTSTPYEPPVVMPITDRNVAIQLALQADRNWVQRDRPITVEMIAADPTIVTAQRFASQAESGFGVNATIVDGPVWVVTIYGRGVVSMIGMAGGTFETNEVSYEFLERTGTLLGTSAGQITPTPPPPPTLTPYTTPPAPPPTQQPLS
jgi:hypothetical protein